MNIRLGLVPSENAAEVTMEIEDQAGEITIDPDHPGRGLLNIHDRADAIGAEYTFDPLQGTPRHRVHLWVAMPGAYVGATPLRAFAFRCSGTTAPTPLPGFSGHRPPPLSHDRRVSQHP